jgi:hypothetical protein
VIRIGGITTHRHPLEVGTSRLLGLIRRVMARSRRSLVHLEKHDPGGSKLIPEELLAQIKTAGDLHCKLLAEQRHRLALVDGNAPQLSEAEYHAEIEALAHDAVLALPRAQLDAWLAEREKAADGRATDYEPPGTM